MRVRHSASPSTQDEEHPSGFTSDTWHLHQTGQLVGGQGARTGSKPQVPFLLAQLRRVLAFLLHSTRALLPTRCNSVPDLLNTIQFVTEPHCFGLCMSHNHKAYNILFMVKCKQLIHFHLHNFFFVKLGSDSLVRNIIPIDYTCIIFIYSNFCTNIWSEKIKSNLWSARRTVLFLFIFNSTWDDFLLPYRTLSAFSMAGISEFFELHPYINYSKAVSVHWRCLRAQLPALGEPSWVGLALGLALLWLNFQARCGNPHGTKITLSWSCHLSGWRI